jgi:hypothetical protein
MAPLRTRIVTGPRSVPRALLMDDHGAENCMGRGGFRRHAAVAPASGRTVRRRCRSAAAWRHDGPGCALGSLGGASFSRPRPRGRRGSVGGRMAGADAAARCSSSIRHAGGRVRRSGAGEAVSENDARAGQKHRAEPGITSGARDRSPYDVAGRRFPGGWREGGTDAQLGRSKAPPGSRWIRAAPCGPSCIDGSAYTQVEQVSWRVHG